MSAHIWESKRFAPSTLEQAAGMFRWAQGLWLEYTVALTFIGYAMERSRQGDAAYRYHERAHRSAPTYQIIWEVVSNTGHRYRNGANRKNYLLAGERLLSAAAELLTDLAAGSPPHAVWDRMLEPAA